MAEHVDVLVVGGGPAGAAAAITAARAGLSTVVCDKAAFPRDKTCGDGLTADALRLLERLGLETKAVASWTPVTDVVLRSPSGRVVELRMPDEGLFAAVAPRASLDAELFDLAGRSGADLRPGLGLEAIDHQAKAVRARLSNGDEITARWVVAADGVYSAVRKLTTAVGLPYLGEWHAFRQYWTGVKEDERLWVLFEADLLPGYAWVFPLGGGRANVGFGILRRPGESARPMAAIWRGLPQRETMQDLLGPVAEPEGPHRAWPIPANLSRAPLTLGRVLFAGDAAGATDPMTGEGIAQALHTGILAAEAIAGGDHGCPVTAAYEAAVEHHVGRDVRFAAGLGRVLSHRKGARAAVRAAGLTPWTRRHFVRWMFEDYPRALLLTPDRWRRGAFGGSGAYRSS